MEKIICYTSLLPLGQSKELHFKDILLDDRWADGDFICSENIYSEVGNINHKLQVKQNYEFLLRVAEKYTVTAMGKPVSSNDATVNLWESFRTDCYVIGKYQKELQAHGYWDTVVTSLIQQALDAPWKDDGISFLESMISHSALYYEINDNTRPILLYYGVDSCLNLLNLFIDSLTDAFRLCHQRVEVLDCSRNPYAPSKYIGQHFKAIIGIQTPVFSIKLEDNLTYLHDLIIGPKYNMLFDHPAWIKLALTDVPNNYHVLYHDRNYIAFSQKYYPKVSGYVYLPPGGILPNTPFIPMSERAYDISFIGCYHDYRSHLATIYSFDNFKRHLAAQYMKIMLQNPDYTGEQALMLALEHNNIHLDHDDFLELFYCMGPAYFCIYTYYREKIIETLLNNGIHLHVFSETWMDSPFKKHPCLTIHDSVDAKLSLQVMQNSKISLNIMSWHKDGMTERVFNSMLCQSVVLSDSTAALQEHFTNNQDLLLFSLKELSSLPSQVKQILSCNDLLQNIAANGYKKALSHHTWQQRALELLQILDNGEK